MKKINYVVLEECEVQHQRESILIAFCGVNAVWERENEVFLQILYSKKNVFFGSREKIWIARTVKYQKVEKLQLLTF